MDPRPNHIDGYVYSITLTTERSGFLFFNCQYLCYLGGNERKVWKVLETNYWRFRKAKVQRLKWRNLP